MTHRPSSLIALGAALSAVVVTIAGCPTPGPVSTFGALCSSADACAPFLCRPDPTDGLQRCLPPRQPSEPGETCASPIVADVRDGSTLVDEVVFFGAATADVDTACGAVGDPDLVVRFTLSPRAGEDATIPQGISIRADGNVAVELRPAGCSEERVRFGCAAVGETALVAEVLPGDYDLIVDGRPAGIGTTAETATRVVVERIDCPTGALPFDEQRCLRTSLLPPLLTARVDHTAHILSDDTVVVVGGTDGISTLDTVEVFDPTVARWQFGELGISRQGHGSVVVDDEIIAIGGNAFEARGSFSQVAVTRIPLPEAHTFIVRSPLSLLRTPTKAIVGLGADDRMIVLSSDFNERGIYLLDENGEKGCDSDQACGSGERCLLAADPGGRPTDGICVCLNNVCSAKRSLVRRDINDGRLELNDGVALVVVGARRALVTGLTALPVGIIDFRSDVAIVSAVVPPVAAPRQRHAALVAIDDRRAWIIGGIDDADQPLATIVEVDLAFNTATLLPFSLPTPVARPRAQRLGDTIVIVDDGDLPVVMDLNGQRRPAPVIAPRRGSVVVQDDDRTVIVGGLDSDGRQTTTVQQLELVPRRAPAPLPLPGCVALPLPDDGVIAGNTQIEDDTFRSVRCDAFLFPYGRDMAFTFSLTSPQSMRIVDVDIPLSAPDGAGYRFFLLRGDCLAYEEVACGDGAPELPLFVPELPAGDYTLIVEYAGFNGLFDEQVAFGGSEYSARVLFGAPDTCPLDPRDPADDVVTGALALLPTENDQSFVEAEGKLCAADVDHVLVEHWGGFSSLSTFGVPDRDATIHRAVIDETASIAGNALVASGVVGEPIDDIDDLPPGHFLVTMSAPADSLDAVNWLAQFSPGCRADPGDSLVLALDDRTVARAPTLTPGAELERSLCVKSDVDVIVLAPGAGADSFVDLDSDALDVSLFAIVDGALGAPQPFTTTVGPFERPRLELGQLTAPVALRIAVRADEEDDVPFEELGVFFGQRQLGDVCETPLPLNPDNAASGEIAVDAAPFNNDNDEASLGGCTGFGTPGPDIVFAVTLGAGDTLDATLTPTDDDEVAIYLLDTCPTAEDSCVVGDDSGGGGATEEITFTNDTAASQTFFVVVDSFSGSPWSATLGWSITAP